MIGSSAVTNRIFFLRKDLFSFMRAQYVLGYHLIFKYHGADYSYKLRPNLSTHILAENLF